ncbi:MAG: efflux RND transporter permease subunit [Candidatus Tumulicola sp.]
MKLTELFIRRPTLVTVFLALVLLAGTISANALVKQQFPNYDVPTIQIALTYPGGSTTQIRDAIVRPIEDQIAGAPDLQAIETAIQPAQATIVARFTLKSDQNADLVQVQGRVQNAQRQLPSDLQTPQITIYDPSQAVVVSLTAKSATLGAGQLSALVTNKVVPAIEQVPGISFVEVNGAVTPSYQVEVDPRAMSASGFTLTDVVNAISLNNVRAPGGIAYEPNRETSIDIRGDVQTPATVAGLLLGSANGSAAGEVSTSAFGTATRLMKVGDVARVVDAYEPQRVYGYDRGTPAISLDVQKAANTSEVEASNAVLAQLPRLARQFPDIAFTVQNVQATYTKEQLGGVIRTLAEAIAITALVMLFFLKSWRGAIVVMIAIPASLLVTLAAMRALNFTLDTVSLLAMTLIIGILVDDSIVVLENIERHADGSELPEVAAYRGRAEIGMAALVITLVDVVVFLPISFLPGAVGLFLREFGLVVSVATLTSLFVSFTVTPALAAHWSLVYRWEPWKPIRDFGTWFERLRGWYVERALLWGFGHRRTVIAVSFASLGLALLALPLGIVGFEYVPAIDRGELFLTMTYPTGTPLETTRRGVLAVERMIDGSSDVAGETALAGAYQGNLPGYVNNAAVGQIHVFLRSHRSHSTAQTAAMMQQAASGVVPAARIVAIPATSTTGGIAQPIDEVVSAPAGDPADAAARVYAALASTPGAIDATTSDNPPSPQVEVQFDRDRARALGVSVGTAADAIRAAFGGTLATQFPTSDGLKDVQVIYPQADQISLAAISAIPIRSTSGSIVTVGDVTTVGREPAPPLITRINRQTVIYVGANAAARSELSNVQRAFNARVKALNLGSGVSVAPVTGGNEEFVRETVVGMSISLALSFLLVYLLMVALYNGYRTPLVVMFSVPVAVVGALGGLAITHQTLNLFSFIGSVLLVGLVSKNGILLVDFANRLRLTQRGTRAAMIEAAFERFRPIVMTTVAMIAGMLPLALAVDRGAEAARSLGTVVIGGLASSLVLTLLLVPIVYLRLGPSVEEIQEEHA